MTKGSVFTGWTYGREIPGMMRFPSKKQPSKRGRYTAHILPPSGANRAALHRRLAYPGAAARASRRRTNHRRSEERRVGKECRSRWSPYDERKKTGGGHAQGAGWGCGNHNGGGVDGRGGSAIFFFFKQKTAYELIW